MNRILRLVFENFKRIGTDGRNAAEESSAGGRTDGGWRNTKNILSALLLSSSVFLSAEEWYRHTIPNGIEIISRAENGQKNFQPRRLEPSDDHVIIDFRDTHYNPKIFTGIRRENGVLKADFSTVLRDGKRISGHVVSQITEHSANRIRWDYTLTLSEPADFGNCYFGIGLNEAMLGRTVRLLSEQEESVVLDAEKEGCLHHGPWNRPVREVKIPLNRGELTVRNFPYPGKRHSVSVFKYGKKQGHIRLWAAYGPVRELKYSMEIEYAPWESEPIPLRSAANMGLADSVADDRRGGWTDQGPDNDLRIFPVGKHRFGPALFDVTDPATNNGKAVMVFANPSRSYFLREAALPVGGKHFDYLYLLHCTAWSSKKHIAGTIEVRYGDGSTQKITVRDQYDTANWWSTQNVENAPCVWSSENFFSTVGLFMTRFPVDPSKPIESLLFRTGNQSVWCVVGVSGVRGKNIPFSFHVDRETPLLLTDGKKWKLFRYTFQPFYIQDHSAYDLSFQSGSVPAGSLGKLRVNGEHFVFEKAPDKPVRFWGANITEEANMLRDRELKLFPKLLKQLGYNAVRLHHFDELLMKKGAKFEIRPEMLDRFFRTFAAFKQAGLYVTLDLFTGRVSGFEEMHGKTAHIYKILSWYHPSVRKNMERFAAVILGTKNPYTGMTLAEDPALISVGLINENPRLETHEEHKYPNAIAFWNRLYKPLFDAWCREKGFPQTDRPAPALWAQFQTENHIRAYRHYRNVLRGLGVTVPISDISNSSNLVLAPIRSNFDYTDIHWYFDHPTVSPDFKPPFLYRNTSSLSTLHETPLASISQRLKGKPVMVTEWHFCVPNQYRAEGGAAGGAYAALNGVSGAFDFNPILWRYAWGEPMSGDYIPMGMFSTLEDPINFYNALITSLLFLRGDVKESEKEFLLRVSPEIFRDPNALLYSNYGRKWMAQPLPSFKVFGAVGKIGIEVTDGKGTPGSFDNNELLKTYRKEDPFSELRKRGYMKNGEIVSSTGEITVNPSKKQLKVITPRSEALVQAGDAQKGKLLSVRKNTTFSNVFAGALDNAPLSDSRRILLIHTTNVMPSARFTTHRGRLLQYKTGCMPYYLRKGSVEISLKNRGRGQAKLYALDMHGRRIAPISFTERDGTITFRADNDLGKHSPMAYELIRE